MDSAYKGYQSDDPNKPYYRASNKSHTMTNDEYYKQPPPVSPDYVLATGRVYDTAYRPKDSFEPDTLLEERGHTHGEYKDGAAIIQATKNLWRAHPGWQDLNNCQKESFDMFATKCGRILAGDQNCVDSWADISGYAQLIVNMLKK